MALASNVPWKEASDYGFFTTWTPHPPSRGGSSGESDALVPGWQGIRPSPVLAAFIAQALQRLPPGFKKLQPRASFPLVIQGNCELCTRTQCAWGYRHPSRPHFSIAPTPAPTPTPTPTTTLSQTFGAP